MPSDGRLRVVVLCGGTSSEREISLASGQAMFRELDPGRFRGQLIDLKDVLLGGDWPIERLARSFDVAFLALHGPGGEDGRLQGMLDLYGLPYTGSGVLASALAMSKPMAKRIYRDAGLPVAKDLVYARSRVATCPLAEAVQQVDRELGWPAVVKADNQGSTRGVRIAQNPADFAEAWQEAARFCSGIMVEKFVRGREFTVGVLGGSEVRALPVVEIIPKTAAYFTYEAKYAPGGSEEIVPAQISDDLTKQLQALGVAAHQALGCWGVSRTDVLVDDGQPYVIETNSLPGMTVGSLLPKAVRAAGMTQREMVSTLIDAALERLALEQAPQAGSHVRAARQ